MGLHEGENQRRHIREFQLTLTTAIFCLTHSQIHGQAFHRIFDAARDVDHPVFTRRKLKQYPSIIRVFGRLDELPRRGVIWVVRDKVSGTPMLTGMNIKQVLPR